MNNHLKDFFIYLLLFLTDDKEIQGVKTRFCGC